MYEVASKAGPQILEKYILLHVRHLLDTSNDYAGALEVLKTRGTPTRESALPIYESLAKAVFQVGDKADQKRVSANITTPEKHLIELFTMRSNLRAVLQAVVNTLVQHNPHGEVTKKFELLLQIAHFLKQRSVCVAEDLKELAAKVSVALVRYVKFIPYDRAFLDAGVACREAGMLNLCFIFFNQFCDTVDFILEPANGLDATDFLETDIPKPHELKMPTELCMTEDDCEDVRDWVLERIADNDMSQELPTRTCTKCKQQTFEGSVTCHNCSFTPPTCIVSGYPIAHENLVKCKSCSQPANRQDWNGFLLKHKKCPWCDQIQNPVF
jgi:intraflagellar transport protein 172